MEQLTLDQQRIVSENHNLIYSLANKKNINLDEYYDVLAIGLCKAAIAFDDTKGKFSTLAYTVMLNEYKQELRKQQNERAIPQDKLLSFDVPIQTDQDNQFASFADVIPDENVQVEQEAIHALTYKSLSSKALQIIRLQKHRFIVRKPLMKQLSIWKQNGSLCCFGFSGSY